MHFMNPQVGAHMGSAAPQPAQPSPDQGAGDGFNHCQIDETQNGATATHTDPSGQVTTTQSASYAEALESAAQKDSGSDTDSDKDSKSTPSAPPADSGDSGY